MVVRLSVCIVTFRRPGLLQRCLNCISPSRQTLDSSLYEVIVSDDCPEQSARSVVENSGFAHWISGPSKGVAANRNNIAKAATGDWIVFVDDDELPQHDWLAVIYAEASTGKWDVIQGRVDAFDCPDSIFWYAPIVNLEGMTCTANLGIRKKSFFGIGGFDNRLKVSHEDVELGIRIRSAGLRVCFLDTALVLHPARRLSLSQVVNRTIQQQCQDCLLGNKNAGFRSVCHILSWNLMYIYRAFKLYFSATGLSRWRTLFTLSALRVVCYPVVCFRLLCSQTNPLNLGDL
jgi:glycosyltransferase involved in cell wall biosynthesis